jgi:hypothetical protein
MNQSRSSRRFEIEAKGNGEVIWLLRPFSPDQNNIKIEKIIEKYLKRYLEILLNSVWN